MTGIYLTEVAWALRSATRVRAAAVLEEQGSGGGFRLTLTVSVAKGDDDSPDNGTSDVAEVYAELAHALETATFRQLAEKYGLDTGDIGRALSGARRRRD